MTFLDGIQPYMSTDWGQWARRQDALSQAGSALPSDPDNPMTGVRNGLLSAGYPDVANTVQGWSKTQAEQDRLEAKDAADEKTKADIRAVGTLAAAGTPEALDAARTEAFKRGLFTQAGSLDEMTKAARADIANKVSAYAANTTDDDWNTNGLALLKRYGIDPSGYEGPAGRQRAIAEGKMAQPVYQQTQLTQRANAKAQAAQELQEMRGQNAVEVARLKQNTGQAGNAFIKSVSYIKQVYPGISEADAEQMAANPKLFRVQTQEGPDGQPSYFLQKIDAATKSQVDAADRIARENAEANKRDGGSRPETFSDVYFSLPQFANARLNAATRQASMQFNTNPAQPGSPAYVRTPEGAEAVSAARGQGSYEGKSVAQQAERVAPLSQINEHFDQAIADANNAESKDLFGRLAMSDTARGVRETLNPNEVDATLGRRNVISAVENIREEVQRFYRIMGARRPDR